MSRPQLLGTVPVRTGPFQRDHVEVYADNESVSFQGTTVRWREVEWFGYSWDRRLSKNHRVTTNIKNQVIFAVGHGGNTQSAAPAQIRIDFTYHGSSDDPARPWQQLTALCKQHVEPRLFQHILARVRAGQRVPIGEGYTIDMNGVQSPDGKKFFRWLDVTVEPVTSKYVTSGISISSTDKLFRLPAILPMAGPNVRLLPELHSALRS